MQSFPAGITVSGRHQTLAALVLKAGFSRNGWGTKQGERAAVCRSAENDSSPERASGRPAAGGVEVGQAEWETLQAWESVVNSTGWQ